MGVLMEPTNANLGRDGADPRLAAEPDTPAPSVLRPGYYAGGTGFTLEMREGVLSLRGCRPVVAEPLLNPPVANGLTSVRAGSGEHRVEAANTVKWTAQPPPKKKWIKEYLEEEPQSPTAAVSVSVAGAAARGSSPVPVPPAPRAPAHPPLAPLPHPPHLPPLQPQPADFIFEHSRPRSNSHGRPSVPSPTSSCGGAAGGGRAGTREVHNKLEKNRRAHLKECFELLKRQLPANTDEKKASNLSILGSANRYIQVLRRKERECEHEMERLAREKIAAQQRLAALKREVATRQAHQIRTAEASPSDDRERDEGLNGQLLGIPISISSPLASGSAEATGGAGGRGGSPPRALGRAAEPRTLPVQITPTAAQNGQPSENGLAQALGTALVHPAHLHLPLSQMVASGGLLVGQLLSGPAGALALLQQPSHLRTNGGAGGPGGRGGRDARLLPRGNGSLATAPAAESGGSLVVNGLTPLVVSQASARLLRTHSFTHKMLETQVVKRTVSAQYLSAAAIVKPMVVVSEGHAPSGVAPGAADT